MEYCYLYNVLFIHINSYHDSSWVPCIIPSHIGFWSWSFDSDQYIVNIYKMWQVWAKSIRMLHMFPHICVELVSATRVFPSYPLFLYPGSRNEDWDRPGHVLNVRVKIIQRIHRHMNIKNVCYKLLSFWNYLLYSILH